MKPKIFRLQYKSEMAEGPPILKIWKEVSFDSRLGLKPDFLKGKPDSVPFRFAHVVCKDHTHTAWESKDIKNYGEDENGWFYEYSRNVPRERVEVLHISDDTSCGNWILGSLLSLHYPNVKTILFDRYRGWSYRIKDGHLFQNLENLILYGSQGRDYFYEYKWRLPSVKWILMEEDYEWQNEEKKFHSELRDNLDGLVFYHSRDDTEYEEPTTRFFEKPKGWISYELDAKYLIPEERYSYIVYERDKPLERREPLLRFRHDADY